MNRVLAPLGIGLVAFFMGGFLAILGTILLAVAMGDSSLQGSEVTLFKSLYIALVTGGVVATLGLPWLVFLVWGQRPYLPSLVALSLLALAIAVWVPLSSDMNDCAVGIGFPLPVDPCD